VTDRATRRAWAVDGPRVRLTVYLKDGRKLSGEYTYWQAWHRMMHARKQENYVYHDWEALS